MPSDSEALCGLFIVGTDTGVGKTFLTSRIARQLLEAGVSVGAYKPVCSGCEDPKSACPIWQDVEILSEALDDHFPRERICPQTFRAPLAPPVAARLENRAVDQNQLLGGIDWWRGRVDLLLVEGVGGLLCPISEKWTICDLAEKLGFPLLIVARLGLGTINHTLLTVEVAQQRGLTVAGILLNETQPEERGLAGATNPSEIAARCDVPILAVIPYKKAPGLLPLPETSTMNWQSLAGKDFPNNSN
jgi:dethiobiotin synthetase